MMELPTDLLGIEIIESACLDRKTAAVEDRPSHIKEFGVHTAIEEFETGYACFAYLRWLPIDLALNRSIPEPVMRSSRWREPNSRKTAGTLERTIG